MKLSQANMIALIKKELPEALPVPKSDFDNTSGEGIWFRGSEDWDKDGVRIYDAYGVEHEVHPKLDQLLTSNGWYAQPYDAGTLVAYTI